VHIIPFGVDIDQTIKDLLAQPPNSTRGLETSTVTDSSQLDQVLSLLTSEVEAAKTTAIDISKVQDNMREIHQTLSNFVSLVMIGVGAAHQMHTEVDHG